MQRKIAATPAAACSREDATDACDTEGVRRTGGCSTAHARAGTQEVRCSRHRVGPPGGQRNEAGVGVRTSER
jgi:hypothetical protein